MHHVPEELQMELVCVPRWKGKLYAIGVPEFYRYLGSNYPKRKSFASRLLSMFGSTYVCEQVFSIIIYKFKCRSQLSHTHLISILKIASAQTDALNDDAVVQAKRCQVSGSSSSSQNLK